MTRRCQGPAPNSCKLQMQAGTKPLVVFFFLFFSFHALLQFFWWLLLNLSPSLSLSLIHTFFHSLADFDLFSLSASSPHQDLSGSSRLPPRAYVGVHALYFHLFVSLVHLRRGALSQAVKSQNGPLLRRSRMPTGDTMVSLWEPNAVFVSLLSLTRQTVIVAP